MKTFAIVILIIISFIPADAQTTETKPTSVSETKIVEPDFKNAGEQQDYWTVELFKKEYKRQHYKRYKGPMVISKNTYRYDDIVLTAFTTEQLEIIFEKGLFYPEIIAQSFKYRPKIKIKLSKDTLTSATKRDTMMEAQKADYNMRTDSLTISNFKELKFLNTTPTQKRFSFWLE